MNTEEAKTTHDNKQDTKKLSNCVILPGTCSGLNKNTNVENGLIDQNEFDHGSTTDKTFNQDTSNLVAIDSRLNSGAHLNGIVDLVNTVQQQISYKINQQIKNKKENKDQSGLILNVINLVEY